MDLLVTCPNCGRSAEPFDPRSKWCPTCVTATLEEQEELRYAPQPREIITLVPH